MWWLMVFSGMYLNIPFSNARANHYRTLIFYPMSALLTIFCSILQNPLDPHSREDLDRLKVATVMIDRIFSRKLPESELEHFKLVADFIIELKRLAECAIEKAWAEQRAGQ